MNEFKLFAHGEEFDVDAFLASTTLRPDSVWRRGDQRRYYSCIESRYPTSGVEFVLGDGLTVPFWKQEQIAVAYLKDHCDELRALARFPGVAFVLALQYRTAFESNVIALSLSSSVKLMWHCLDVGCELVFYVTLDRLPEPEIEDVESSAAPDSCGM
jgi:hypothetical protein